MTIRNTAGLMAAVGALFAASAPAFAADSLKDSVQQFLNDAQTEVDEARIWKFHLKPSLRESIIWTDNVYLNDDHESNLRLTQVTNTSTGEVITDKATLARIQASQEDFVDAESQDRVDDLIFQSELGLDFVLPVNEAYSKAFKMDRMTILGAKVRNQQYLDRSELDNNSVFLHTDLFGFLADLMNQRWGENVWVRVRDDYSYLRDPLDTSIRLLRQDGITQVKGFEDFGRTENTFNFDVGIHGPESPMDASVGYEHYNLWLSDDELDQAQHSRDNLHAEIGTLVPGLEPLRAFARYDYSQYRFDEAPISNVQGEVVAKEQILNDANVNKGTLGVETRNDKVEARYEFAYENWDPQKGSGLSGDTRNFAGVLNTVLLAYKPWDERNTKFQFSFEQTLDYSAISNYNAYQTAMLSVLHEVVPQRLDADATVAFTTTNPSDGPYRKLLETGFGLTYHLFKQADLTFRYLYRHQTAHHELETNSTFERGDLAYSYTIRSDSAFYQNIVELGFQVRF